MPPFVGRQQERELLHTAASDSRIGHTRMVLIGGVAGVGKTALLDRFVHELGASALVFRGRCHEREALPYKLFDQVLQAIATYLAALPLADARAVLPSDIASLLRLFPELGRVPALHAVAAVPGPAFDGERLQNQVLVA